MLLDAFDALKLTRKLLLAPLLLARIAVRTDEPERRCNTPRQRWGKLRIGGGRSYVPDLLLWAIFPGQF